MNNDLSHRADKSFRIFNHVINAEETEQGGHNKHGQKREPQTNERIFDCPFAGRSHGFVATRHDHLEPSPNYAADRHNPRAAYEIGKYTRDNRKNIAKSAVAFVTSTRRVIAAINKSRLCRVPNKQADS